MEMTVLLWILAAVLTAVGIVGLFLSVIPGAVVLFAGLVIAAWADDFACVGVKTLTVLGVAAKLAITFTMLGVFAVVRFS